MQRVWRFHPYDRESDLRLAGDCDISPVVARLLSLRGVNSPDAVSRFLNARLTDLRPPESLPGLSAAVERIWSSVQDGHEVVIHGDYDADGMTATSILYLCLKRLGGNVSYFLPNRMDEGYGLHPETVAKLAERGKRLIVTVDCGIASLEAARVARRLGIGLVVSDHHQFGDELPDADVIVHPSLPGSAYPFTGLCGAGVAFKIAWGLCQKASGGQRVGDSLREFLLQALALAAIGTVADVVPLIDENRVIVRNGLRSLAQTRLVGISRLLESTKLSAKQSLSSEDVAFMLAPRLNAAGRLGQAQLGVELLTTDDPDRASALADYIQQLNGNRETLERSILLAASKQIKEVHSPSDPALVLAMPGWHPGVIGIVAGKLAERHHKPVVMIALDQVGERPGIGSARSPNGVDLHMVLQSCKDLLISGGGHAAAAGLKIEEQQVGSFRAAFCEAISEQFGHLDGAVNLMIDAETPLGQLDLTAVEQIESLAPFGNGNHRPLLCASGVEIASPPKALGGNGRHLSIQFSQHGAALRAIAFGQAELWMESLANQKQTLDIVFRPVINEFKGFRKVEMHLVDWRPSQTVVPPPHFMQPAQIVAS